MILYYQIGAKTNNKIKNLITEDSLDTDTIMILINAVYFKVSVDCKLIMK